MQKLETDIVIIGSGVAGAIVAKECLKGGKNVIMVEAGKKVNGRAFGLRVLENLLQDYRIPRNSIWHRSRTYKKSDYSGGGYSLRGSAIIARGGSTLSWAGDAYRMKEEDFYLYSNTGIGLDWPITYEELEQYYALGEKTIRVAGDYSDAGHPQRKDGFPVASLPLHPRDKFFLNVFINNNWTTMRHNVSLAPDGSVFTGDEIVDQLEDEQNFTLLTRTIARKIICSSRTTATGVECFDLRKNAALKIHAIKIIVCAGGIETPNLLFESSNTWWPNGLGNTNDHLGNNLISHGGIAYGCRPGGIKFFNGPMHATIASREFDQVEYQSDGKFLLIWRPAPSGLMFANAIFEQFQTDGNSVRPANKNTHFGTAQSIIKFKKDERYKKRRAEISTILEEIINNMGFKVSNKRSYTLAHPMCTVRMSKVPSDGMLDADLKLHALDNVYVCGSASFSSGGAANPTMTIAALAHRLGKLVGGMN